jgi:hypothetical protein
MSEILSTLTGLGCPSRVYGPSNELLGYFLSSLMGLGTWEFVSL